MLPIIYEVIKILVIQLVNLAIQTIRRKYHEKKIIKQKKKQSDVREKRE